MHILGTRIEYMHVRWVPLNSRVYGIIKEIRLSWLSDYIESEV